MDNLFSMAGTKFFSVYGLIGVILLLIPNFIFAKKGPNNRPDDLATCGATVCLVELLSRIALTIVLIVLRRSPLIVAAAVVAVAALLLYYLAWVSYFKGGRNYADIYTRDLFGLPVSKAIFTTVYYIALSVFLSNPVALVLSIVLGCCHIANALAARRDLLDRGGVN